MERFPSLANTLPRQATWEQWESGRDVRRALTMRITGGKVLRRESGNPRKDVWLRQLNAGQRGLPFARREENPARQGE